MKVNRKNNSKGSYFGCFIYNDVNLGKVALIWSHSGMDQSESDGWQPKIIDEINNVSESQLIDFLKKQKNIDQYLFASDSISGLESVFRESNSRQSNSETESEVLSEIKNLHKNLNLSKLSAQDKYDLELEVENPTVINSEYDKGMKFYSINIPKVLLSNEDNKSLVKSLNHWFESDSNDEYVVFESELLKTNSRKNSHLVNSISESGDADLVKMRSELNELVDKIDSLGVPGVSASFSRDKVDIHEVAKNGRDASIGTISIRKFDNGLTFGAEFYTGYGSNLQINSRFNKDLGIALDFILSDSNPRILRETTREKLKSLSKEPGSSNKSDSSKSGDSNKSLDVPYSVKSYVDTAYKRDGFKKCYGYYMSQVRAAKKKGNEKSAAAWQMKADYLMSINKNSRVRNSRGKVFDFRRKINSSVPNADLLVADGYVGNANSDNYLDILSKIAKEIKEKFNVRRKFDTPEDFRTWAESESSISDRMYVIIDYILGTVTGMKSGVRKSNSSIFDSKYKVTAVEVSGPSGNKLEFIPHPNEIDFMEGAPSSLKEVRHRTVAVGLDLMEANNLAEELGNKYDAYDPESYFKSDYSKNSRSINSKGFSKFLENLDRSPFYKLAEKYSTPWNEHSKSDVDRILSDIELDGFLETRDYFKGHESQDFVYAIVDLLESMYFKSDYSKNSRLTNSTGYVLCAELWGDRDPRGLESIEDYYILPEPEVDSRREELSKYKSKDDEMEFLMLYTFPETEDGYSRLLKLLKSTGNAYPGMGVNALKESIENRRPMSLNSRQVNNLMKSNPGITAHIGDEDYKVVNIGTHGMNPKSSTGYGGISIKLENGSWSTVKSQRFTKRLLDIDFKAKDLTWDSMEDFEKGKVPSMTSRSTNSIPRESGDYNIYSAKNKSGVIEDYVVGRNSDEALSEVPPFSKKNITLKLVEEGYSANYADQRANELRENLPEVGNNSRSTNSKSKLLDTVSKLIPSDSNWDINEDTVNKVTLTRGSELLTLEYLDDENKYLLSDEKEVLYITSDLSKLSKAFSKFI